MKIDRIAERLQAIEQRQKRTQSYTVSWPSSADSTAYYLSNGMMKGAPGVIEIDWSHKTPAGDAFKLKWLRQYTPEEIDGFRQSWSKSDYERDKVALKELERLRTLRA